MRVAVLTVAAAVENGGEGLPDVPADASRLRRMDRFGRSGVLAGSRALAAAGRSLVRRGEEPDPRAGVVVGTAFGCRDAVTEHARLLASAARVQDLAPSVFAATVHNSVAGELAILFGLGGVAETLVSGRTAGLEALALAARRVAEGDADSILVVGAEGIHDAMRAAFCRENPNKDLVESAAAVLVQGSEESEDSLSKTGTVVFVDASLSFGEAARGEGSEEDVFLEGVSGAGAAASGSAVIERLGASGLWEIAVDVSAAAASRRALPLHRAEGHSPSKRIQRYAARDVHGSCASVTLAFFS